MNAKKRFIHDGFRMSQEQTAEGWNMPYAHYHDAYEIYVLESGKRTVTIDNTEYNVKAHDATLFGSLIPHKSKGNVPFSGICIHFSEHYLDLYFKPRAKRQLIKCFDKKTISLDKTGFDYIKSAAENFTPEADDNFIILANILNILYKNSDNIESASNKEQQAKKNKSQLIIDYVNENYVSIKKISDITQLFGVSENYIFKIFRTSCGVTPKYYINALRIKHACHRLRCTDSSIKAIASECGYDSYARFSCVFKKLMNTTPSQYRDDI